MNNPFNMTNDLNGFRASVGNSIAQYDHNIDVLNTGVIRKKVAAARKAADTLGKGAELLRTGLETEGAIVGGKLIGAAGRQIYGAVSRKLATAASDVTERLGSTVQSTTSTAADAGDQAISSVRTVATPSGGGNVNPEFRAGQGQEMKSQELDDVSSERPFIDETPDPYGRADTSQRVFGETKDDMDDMDDAPDMVGGGQPRTGLTETKTSDLGDAGDAAGDAADSAVSAAEGAGNVAAGAGDAAQAAADAASSGVTAASDAASAAAGGAADAASAAAQAAGGAASAAGDAASAALAGGGAAAESALAEVAAATSWIPFIGEIMGGVAAVGGLVTAGIGIYDDVKGGIQQGAAEAMADKASNLPSVDLAGSYIAPISSSVNV
tara:strand:- start:3075 stop:4220 length:1146 start_codon:yes stop_codon:yes gene_type:complete